ncbi:hypothetical protein AYP76_00890 [Ligilactobacillus agilis]|uniref:Uncharacterized protein n=2 Tax=Ligilactobacillus agilis TaxID=1601 RepID=A0A231QHV6_9LACO|nr:hypothetical protein [Ligilactobacillus agilis]OXC06550.1 hypothetical protein AYP74_09670 [Ligilactobacillus agilis]OXC06747.1 hypothetical protein AYP76_00890 [Ligilactobacillus agilis]OXC07863.1 hypothetical protein AYP75_09395 [Ligilactobacillus agilis]OXS40246.1 hypothetical protein AYP69_05275 [Ligilactobacillus agilis]OXS41888.1 hypothetical protein AYP70_10860 [Ligilactobacillus agilis]
MKFDVIISILANLVTIISFIGEYFKDDAQTQSLAVRQVNNSVNYTIIKNYKFNTYSSHSNFNSDFESNLIFLIVTIILSALLSALYKAISLVALVTLLYFCIIFLREKRYLIDFFKTGDKKRKFQVVSSIISSWLCITLQILIPTYTDKFHLKLLDWKDYTNLPQIRACISENVNLIINTFFHGSNFDKAYVIVSIFFMALLFLVCEGVIKFSYNLRKRKQLVGCQHFLSIILLQLICFSILNSPTRDFFINFFNSSLNFFGLQFIFLFPY